MISALPEMRATIHLSFHKTSAEELAEGNPLVAQVLKLGKERTGRHAVSIPRLAAALDISFASLQEQLRELAAAGEVSYTSSDRALCFEVRRVCASLAHSASHALLSSRSCVRRAMPRRWPPRWLRALQLRSSARLASWTPSTAQQLRQRRAATLRCRRASCDGASPRTLRLSAARSACPLRSWCVAARWLQLLSLPSARSADNLRCLLGTGEADVAAFAGRHTRAAAPVARRAHFQPPGGACAARPLQPAHQRRHLASQPSVGQARGGGL
jgi:hypothetical protein